MILSQSFVSGLVVTILLAVVSPVVARSQSPQSLGRENELREILTSKSITDLDSRQNERERRRDRKDSCEAQLKNRAIPRDCFDGDSLSRPTELARLLRICLTSARESRSRLELMAINDHETNIPEPCLKVARERLEDLRYVDESQHPEMSVVRTSGLDLEE